MNLFRIPKRTSHGRIVPIKTGNNLTQHLEKEYYIDDSILTINPDKNEVKFKDNTILYKRIWVIPSSYSHILLDQGDNYYLIGKYLYKFELPMDHTSEIIDFEINESDLYAVSSTYTYLLLEKPVWIENKMRTSYNPYQQWNELSDEKEKKEIVFIPLEYYQESDF